MSILRVIRPLEDASEVLQMVGWRTATSSCPARAVTESLVRFPAGSAGTSPSLARARFCVCGVDIGQLEDDENKDGETHARNGSHLLGEAH